MGFPPAQRGDARAIALGVLPQSEVRWALWMSGVSLARKQEQQEKPGLLGGSLSAASSWLARGVSSRGAQATLASPTGRARARRKRPGESRRGKRMPSLAVSGPRAQTAEGGAPLRGREPVASNSSPCITGGMADPRRTIATWLILPVVICLSQRLSHACLSISNYTAKLRMAH